MVVVAFLLFLFLLWCVAVVLVVAALLFLLSWHCIVVADAMALFPPSLAVLL